jgi:hypothetical protein
MDSVLSLCVLMCADVAAVTAVLRPWFNLPALVQFQQRCLIMMTQQDV